MNNDWLFLSLYAVDPLSNLGSLRSELMAPPLGHGGLYHGGWASRWVLGVCGPLSFGRPSSLGSPVWTPGIIFYHGGLHLHLGVWASSWAYLKFFFTRSHEVKC